jgi:uncharacterized protein (DUF433 family)
MVSRYPLNLPAELKQSAARLAKQQGVSLNQFFLWSISEKVAELQASIDDPLFPAITYRRGASGVPTPVVRGAGIRVETLVVAHHHWGQPAAELAHEYDLSLETIDEALAYYQAHQGEIDMLIRIEQEIEARHVKT